MSNPGHNANVNKKKLVTDLEQEIGGLEYDQTVPENSVTQNFRYANEEEAARARLREVLATPAEEFAAPAETPAKNEAVASAAPEATRDGVSYRDDVDYNDDGTPNVMAPKE